MEQIGVRVQQQVEAGSDMRCRFTWAQWRVNKCKISTKKDSADPNNLKV